jgi:hypothetical protein
MIDHSGLSVAGPAIVSVIAVSWFVSHGRKNCEKLVKERLRERYPAIEFSKIEKMTLYLRFRGFPLTVPLKEIYAAASKKKDLLAPALDAALSKATGCTEQELQAAPQPAASTGVPELQFEKAEFIKPTGAQRCALCQTALRDEYFEVNQQVLCSSCKTVAYRQLKEGSDWQFVPRAAWRGLIAAAVGCAIYYAISALTGYEFALIAIIVGLMIGNAVRKASLGRGGWIFQTLAVGLTYSAIVMTYAPQLFTAIRALELKRSSSASLQNAVTPPHAPPLNPNTNASGHDATAAISSPMKHSQSPMAAPSMNATPLTPSGGAWLAQRLRTMPAFVRFIVGISVVVALIFAVPFLAGMKGVMGLFIIGFALYEAWKLNRKTVLNISGPYHISPTSDLPAAATDVPSA